MTTRRRRDPAGTRRRILDAAFAEFSEKGLAGARMQAIAERSGLDKKLVYHHFTDKESLFRALYVAKLAEVEAVREAMPQDMADAFAAWQAAMIRERPWMRFVTQVELAYGTSWIPNEEARRQGWLAEQRQLADAQERGEVAPELDAAQLQLSLVALVTFPVVFAQLTKLITGRDPDDPQFLEERARFLRALAARLGG
jgi:TetR/AcrR family transcriptional regulator